MFGILKYCHLLCYPLEDLVRLRDTIVLTLPLVFFKEHWLISCVALSSCSVTQDGAAEVERLDILLVLRIESLLVVLERSGRILARP